MDQNAEMYCELLRIRKFEETVLLKFKQGIFQGTTHTYLGQEANAVGVISQIQPEDVIFSNHRCHGHFLAYGGDMQALFAEMMGKESGICAGRGGSQHLHWRNFFSNGVQGGIVPISTGMAFAEKLLKSEAIAICFIGDGTLGQGVVYETLNMACLWGIPILYVLENNKIAQTTPIEKAVAGGLSQRFNAFGITTSELASYDVLEIRAKAREIILSVRSNRYPHALILHTERFGPHSKGDDTRDSDEVEFLKKNCDPLFLHGQRLSTDAKEFVEFNVQAEVNKAFEKAIVEPASTQLGGSSLIENKDKRLDEELSPHPDYAVDVGIGKGTVLARLNQALKHAMAADDRLIVLGEDILDPYGGAFKVTRGLSTDYPDRVVSTPISEAGMIGIAAGMAMRGMRPVVEIMFGDFLTLGADQIVNHIAKFHWMYNGQVNVPILIRTPMGGRRGYGPTHSQTIEKIFLGVPGLVVIAPSDQGDPGELLLRCIQDDNPILFIENKLLYLQQVLSEESSVDFDLDVDFSRNGYPIYSLKVRGAPNASLTMISYGHMGVLAREAVKKLAYESEIFVDLFILTQLSPFDLDSILDSVVQSGRILTVEEGSRSLGWGAEVIAQVAESLGADLHYSNRLAAQDLPIPAAVSLERFALPGIEDIVNHVKGIAKIPLTK